jgi:hypothetical protein
VFREAERARRAGIIAGRRTELQELEVLEVVTPTRLFDKRLSLDFEGTRIEIQDRGPANSPNDATNWHGYTRALRAVLEATLTRVETMVRAGRTMAQVQDELNLDDVRGLVPEWSRPGVSAEDWDHTRRTLAERAFVGIRGQGGR